MSQIHSYALHYVALGFKVLALEAKSKQPHKKLAPRGMHSATDDIFLISEWFDADPNINIGIYCKGSNLVVFDVDFRNGGTIDGLPPTRRIKTGDGYHYYYTATQDMSFPGKWREGVDIKWNGYVVAAPSIHPSGQRYYVDDITPFRSVSELVGAM